MSQFERDIRRVDRRAKTFLGAPSEENVHDLRTALRRIETRSEILPKRFKKTNRKLSRHLSLCRACFKSSTKIRDLDIILQRISSYGPLLLSDGRLLDELRDKRERAASRCERVANKLVNRDPRFDESTLKEAKLRKRFESLRSKLNGEIQTLLPIVREDPRRIKELHSLRKSCKRLRYLLETSGEEEAQAIQALEKWQDHLGTIHDCDVVIQYLSKQVQSEEISEVTHEVEVMRDGKYNDFVGLLNRAGLTYTPQQARRTGKIRTSRVRA